MWHLDIQILGEKDEDEFGSDDEYEGDDVFNDPAELDRIDEEIARHRYATFDSEYEGADVLDDLAELERLQDETAHLLPGPRTDRPRRLYGFCSESHNTNLLLACSESRSVALKYYQPMFSSLGGIAQIYFDTTIDTLFIDTNTFPEEYLDLPVFLKRYLLSSDILGIEHLAVEGFGAHVNTQHQLSLDDYG